MLFFFILIIGSLISISSNSWFGVWVGLEVNLISFIPLILLNEYRLNNSESALNYFLVQAIGSSLLLFSIIFYYLSLVVYEFIEFRKYNIFVNFILLSLILKLGAAPFHFWIPNVGENVNWNILLILLIWQKLAPIVLVIYLNYLYNLVLVFVILRTFIGSLGGLNQLSIHKLLVFSSINHIGWIFYIMLLHDYIWLFYYFVYILLNISVIYFFNMFQVNYLVQLSSLFYKQNYIKWLVIIGILSLGGLPPFLGFLPKLIVINLIINNCYYFIIFYFVILRLLILKVYLNIRINSYIFISELLSYTSLFNIREYLRLKGISLLNISLIFLLTFLSLLGFFMLLPFYLIIF